MKISQRFLLVLLALLSAGARAGDPGYYLVSPYDQAGQLGVELRYWTIKRPQRGAVLWPEAALSYGINSRWTTRVLASGIGTSLGEQKLASINWQNVVLLTQGERPYDLALHAQVTRLREQGNAVELGPVWQTDLGRVKLNANLIWEYDSSPGRHDTRLKLQWRGLLRVAPGWRLGVLGFDELGPWTRWLPAARQSHRAGPALLATLHDSSAGRLELQAAFLWGKHYGRQGDMFTSQLQWLR